MLYLHVGFLLPASQKPRMFLASCIMLHFGSEFPRSRNTYLALGSMFKKIRQFIARSGGTPLFNVATQRFGSVDRRALEVEIDLNARAKEQGKANLPPLDQRDKDALAMDIDAHLAQVVREGRDELNDHMAALRRADDMVKTWDEYITERNTTFRAALTRLFETAKNGVNALYLQREKVADSERAYQQFRKKYNIERPSDHALDRPRALLWIVVVVIVESLFNAYALGGVHPEGPVGVLVDTVGISIVNVVVLAWCMGYALRRYSRDELAERLIGGILALFIVLALVVPFNLFVAHYRDALLALQSYAASGDVASAQDYLSTYKKTFSATWESAFSLDDWYKFGSTTSALLLPIGIGMFGWAAAKWRYMEDALHGYSRLVRAKDQRAQEYETLEDDRQRELRQIAGRSTDKINGMHEMAVAALRNVETHESTRRHLREKYVAWVNEVTTLGEALYAQYREINMQYRESEMPAAFEIPFQLPKDLVEPPVLPVQNEPVSDKWVAMQHERVEKQNTLIAEGHNRYLEIYKTIGELAPKDLADSMGMPFDDAAAKVNTELQTKAGRIQ